MINFFKKNTRLLTFGLVIFYLFTHLLGLLELPVFADEAIYIRWSQLIIDDLPRYLFFAMNDGKTPLFFWLLVPFQFLFNNQLFAARFVSVLVGLVQMLIVMKTVSFLTKNQKTIFLSGLMVTILPFWYFHHRMVLTDGLMTLLISLSMMFLVREFINPISRTLLNKRTMLNVVLAGLFFGLSLLTKIPAILFAPGLFLLIFVNKKISLRAFYISLIKVSLIIGIGLFMFVLLKFAPSFSQLFGRGSDFLFPFNEVISGRWKETLPSLPVYFGYFFSYLTPTFMIFLFMGLFAKKNKSYIHIFFWSGILFILPIALMGRIVYARYLFPASLFFTLAGVLSIEDFFVRAKKFHDKLIWQSLFLGILVLLLANTFGNSAVFMITSITDSKQIPFVSSDVVQYLTEWSSGHGIYETFQLISKESKNKTIAIATEGSFGSLPDGLNLYFHRRNVSNIAIDGVGFPVKGIPEKFAQAARNFDEQWLVINSHRLNFDIDRKYLITEFCRPFSAPCLQVWDITDVFEELTLD